MNNFTKWNENMINMTKYLILSLKTKLTLLALNSKHFYLEPKLLRK